MLTQQGSVPVERHSASSKKVSFRLPCLTSKLLDDYAVWFVNGQ
jgi:hypothetical protein